MLLSENKVLIQASLDQDTVLVDYDCSRNLEAVWILEAVLI